VKVAALSPKQQLAYWLNVDNINVVATIVEHYPVDSIGDISTDPIIRLNVFKKERVPFGAALLSLGHTLSPLPMPSVPTPSRAFGSGSSTFLRRGSGEV
jgi:hypothetical protein